MAVSGSLVAKIQGMLRVCLNSATGQDNRHNNIDQIARLLAKEKVSSGAIELSIDRVGSAASGGSDDAARLRRDLITTQAALAEANRRMMAAQQAEAFQRREKQRLEEELDEAKEMLRSRAAPPTPEINRLVAKQEIIKNIIRVWKRVHGDHRVIIDRIAAVVDE